MITRTCVGLARDGAAELDSGAAANTPAARSTARVVVFTDTSRWDVDADARWRATAIRAAAGGLRHRAVARPIAAKPHARVRQARAASTLHAASSSR
jgi:hypothetical protein